MKVLVIGKNGMLGNAIMRASKNWDFEVIGLNRNDLDVTDKEAVRNVIAKHTPSANTNLQSKSDSSSPPPGANPALAVVNCVGCTDVDLCERDTDLANAVNAEAVEYMAEACEEVGAKFIHISTDYVFDGTGEAGYEEDHQTGPINEYGKSKLKGEELAQKCEQHFIIRVSWLFGTNRKQIPGRKDFIATILEWSESSSNLKILNNQIGKVTYVDDVAKAIKDFLLSSDYGIYHLCNEGELTRYEFAKEVFSILKRDDIAVHPATLKDLGITWKARRPEFSSLINTKYPKLRPWKEALTEYLNKEYV